MVIVGYSDYYLTKVHTKEQLDVEMQKLLLLTQDYLQANQEASPELYKITLELQQQFKIVESLHQEYQIKNKSCTLYGMLIVGVAVLLDLFGN